MKNGCALLEGSHPSVLQHTSCTACTLCPFPLAPLPLNPQQGCTALQSPWWGVTYETLHPRIPNVPDHSARLAKLPLLCSHYPFNFPLLRGVSFLLLRLIQVKLYYYTRWNRIAFWRESVHLIDYASLLEGVCIRGVSARNPSWLFTQRETQKCIMLQAFATQCSPFLHYFYF